MDRSGNSREQGESSKAGWVMRGRAAAEESKQVVFSFGPARHGRRASGAPERKDIQPKAELVVEKQTKRSRS